MIAKAASCFLFLALVIGCTNAATQCPGGLDIYVILDKSGSIGNFTPDFLFVSSLTQQFTSDQTRFAFVLFDSTPTLVTSLTSDRVAIARGLAVLQNTAVGGGTIFAPAFQMVYDMMSDTTSISAVFFVTDGVSNNPNTDGVQAIEIANRMRKKGAEIYAISQGTQTNPAYMQSIVNTPTSVYYQGSIDYQALPTLAQALVDRSCIYVARVQGQVCFAAQAPSIITLQGVGFNQTQRFPRTAPLCRFGTPPGRSFAVPGVISPDGASMQCSVPTSYQYFFTNSSSAVLTVAEVEMSVNNQTFTRSNFTVVLFWNCITPPTVTAPASLLWLLIFIPLLLLLWYFWPYLMGVSKHALAQGSDDDSDYADLQHQPLAEVHPSNLPPGKNADGTWSKIDTSKYVWAREGGSARPMPVQWGDLGATSSAAHLEHSEYSVQTGDHSAGANAERLSNCETDYETADSTSCCDEFISSASIKARSMWVVACDAYARIANLRPLRN